MREIKFRGWDSESQEMLPTQDLTQSSEYWGWLGKKDVILMQYTGLKDKNGREIYDGDVISGPEYYEAPENASNGVVVFGEVVFLEGCWWIKTGSSYECLWEEYEANDHHLEIVGNIHETPELLK